MGGPENPGGLPEEIIGRWVRDRSDRDDIRERPLRGRRRERLSFMITMWVTGRFHDHGVGTACATVDDPHTVTFTVIMPVIIPVVMAGPPLAVPTTAPARCLS